MGYDVKEEKQRARRKGKIASIEAEFKHERGGQVSFERITLMRKQQKGERRQRSLQHQRYWQAM